MSKNQSQLRVAVLWHDTVVSETLVDGRAVTIGEDVKNTLMIPDVANVGSKYVLFSPDRDGYTLHLSEQMTGKVQLGGKETDVAEARKGKGKDLAISGKDWGMLDLGPLAIFFQFVDDRAAVPVRPIWGTLDAPVLGSLLTALTLHLGVLIAAFMLYEDKPQLTDIDLDDRFMKVIVEEPPPEIEEKEEEESVDEDVGKKAGGEEGKFGEEDKKDKSKVPKRDGEMVDKIKDVGIHKALGSNLLGRGPLKNVFGDKTGFDSKLNAAMSGVGDELVVGNGAGGMGLRGTGTGGGGEGFGRIHGMGRIDTGGGRGTRAKLGGKGPAKKKVRVKAAGGSVAGFCKQQDIQRVVSARSSGIQYCYERELARNPELQGKVSMSWRIGLDGKVVKAIVESSTLGNKTVEGCMLRQIERWTFPKPDGGMCQIKYPFVFSAGL
ncbi:MAG: AgmX/PglI C-terminal domain-containing protein [Myxococcales bacterium]|nr:AgmX/PglI C-terminal domain-containing protein [Myxococcales bacterium]